MIRKPIIKECANVLSQYRGGSGRAKGKGFEVQVTLLVTFRTWIVTYP